MSYKNNTDEPSRLSGVAILPWIVALILFLVLAGSVAMVGRGLTTDQVFVSERVLVIREALVVVETPSSETVESKPPTRGGGKPHAEANEGAAQIEPSSDTPVEQAELSGEVLRGAESMHKPEGYEVEKLFETPATASPLEPKFPTAIKKSAAAPARPSAVVSAAVSPKLRSSADVLPPGPELGRVETSLQGLLPRIGLDSREPWKVYARPHSSQDERPRVAIILDGLGLSSAATEAAIQGLPGEVTLAFHPFADNIQQWIGLSRAAGHEVLLNLPMEPVDLSANDPGTRALSVALSPEKNQDRMRWALARVSGYVGIVNHMGSRFTASRDSMQPILAELKARGLLLVDARSAMSSIVTSLATEMEVPRAINDLFLDNREVSRPTVDARLAEVERIAREVGVSIAIGQAFPVTIERIRKWALTLNKKGIALVPISAVVGRQSDR
jgi:polysaccharide deacetylase 2 family uncharacterized protein YibQ